ncbi:MAG: prepilin-type N-terminal cleavage/methylation domain-containing protein [Deltaproteobacteria bacterium]|nr:prepilin-type N-terminal cleavage/methylation domain-containing protein [Deltaproteobacteria bacterium]
MKNKKNRRGFTLVEVLVALTLLGVALGTVCQIFLSQADAYKTQARITQRQQRLRAALEIIARDFRSAGYPALDPSFLAGLTAWIPDSFIPKVPQTVSLSGVATLTPGGNNPDSLSLLIVLSGDTNPTTLSQGVLAGDTFLPLGLNSSETNAQYNRSDLVYIGKPPELAQIDKISGSTLLIDTDPFQPGNQGLKKAYPAGTEVGEISLVSYAVFNDHNDPGGKYHDLGVPVLKRKINAGGFEPLAEDITDLRVSPIKPELFHLQVSVGIGISPTASQAAKKNSLTLSTYIMKRN